MACWLVSFMAFGIPAQVAMASNPPALPTTVPSGLGDHVGAEITDSATGWLEVTQADQEAIMNWNNFDIGSSATVDFVQPNATAAVLNRVTGEGVTGIMGTLNADGRVFVINPAGIVFGSGASVNVAQLVASSLDIEDDDFLNGLPYTFIGGATAGDVINEGTDTITATDGLIALIGKTVTNTGALVAEDGYVIMAAGETVLISENGSGVAVEVTMPEETPGEYDYWVDHGGEGGDGSINAQHVILAAGDIWSAALIKASSDAGSDAVATVDIDAAGNVDIEDEIEAVAVGDGVGGFDATAGVTIDAAGDVEVLGDGKVMAEASDGVNNEANVNITGKNVIVETDGFIDPAVVKAYAHDGDNNTAGVTITAKGIVEGDVVTEGDVLVEGSGAIDQALVEAKAEDGTNKNTATVNITANDNVEVVSDGWNSSASIKAEAVDGSENVATITIAATTGDVQLTHEGGGFLDFDLALIEAKAENLELELPDEDALTLEGLKNTATVTINATEGDVLVTSSGNSAIRAVAQNDIEINYDELDAENSFTVESLVNTAAVNLTGANVEIAGVSGEATVEAIARNEIDVDITHYEDDVTVDLTVTDLENNATVTLDATEGDVLVQGGETEMVGDPPEEGDTTLGDALVAAEAYNVVDIHQHTGGWYKNPDTCEWEKRDDFAATLNLATNDLVNTALADFTAANNIKVIADGSRRRSGSDAIVRAEAYNELVGSGCKVKDVTVYLAAGLILTDDNLVSLLNNADIQMTAVNNNVEVTALRGGFASVKADAYNKVEGVEGQVAAAYGGGHGGDIVVFVEADNVANDSLVDVDAGDDVLVTAQCDEKDSIAEILAYAWNDIPGEPTNEAVNITNNAQIEIDATNVDVKSTDSGEARIFANAYDGTDNTAGVTINADGNVEVMHNDDAEAYIEAVATAPWGNNSTAAVVIDAYGNLLIDNGYVGAWANSGLDSTATVTVDVANVHVNNEGEIMAEAQTYFGGEEGDALATVGITTTGINGVVVENSSEIGSDALAIDSGDATATTTVTASNVTVKEGSGSEIGANAEAYGSGDATATTNVTTTSSEVIVDNDSSIWSYAYADDSGDVTATTIVTADYVTVDNDSEISAHAETHDEAGNALATVDVTTTGSQVIVDDDSEIRSYAYSDASGDATAETTVEADDVTVEDDSKIEAEAEARHAGNAKADVDILAGSVDIRSSKVKAKAETYTMLNVDAEMLDTPYDDDVADVIDLTVSGAATATVDITATDGSVQIRGGNGNADVEADAKNKVEIYIDGDNFDDDVTVNLTAEDLTADAGVTITANENVNIEADGDEAEVEAEAENKFKVMGSDSQGGLDVSLNLTVNPLEENTLAANANVDITATNGDVDILGGSDAEVEAKAKTEFDDEIDEGIDVTETVDNVASNATVNITADSDVTLDEGDVKAEADVEGVEGDATAGVTVNAANLTVEDDSEIEADAETEKGSGDATASIDITLTGSDVLVENDSKIKAEADTGRGSGDAEAAVTIAADNVTVSDNSEIEADAEAEKGSGDATASIDITLTGSDVLVENDSKIKAEADTGRGSGDAAATVTIAADNVTVSGDSEIEADAEAEKGSGNATADVGITLLESDVLVKNGSSILASADAGHGSGDATATTTIIDAENVTVIRGGGIAAYADADYGSGDAEATVDIGATGDVLVEHGGDIEADAETYKRSGDATATVDIDASGNVTVGAGGEITATTEVDNFGGPDGSSSSATSVVDIDSAGDVIVETRGVILADADVDEDDSEEIDAFIGYADADVTITTPGQVTVDGLVKAEADLWNNDNYEGGDEEDNFLGDTYSGSSFANVTIDNRFHGGLGVTVGPDGEIIADSEIINWDHPDSRFEDNVYSGEAFAGIDIQTCGDVIVDGLVRSVANIDTWDQVPENDDYLQTTTADVIVKAFGDVIVNSGAEEEENGQIEAVASNGVENSAGITVLAVGDVIVNDGSGPGRHPRPFLDSREEIRAAAYGDSGSTNNAFVGIATRGGALNPDGLLDPEAGPGDVIVDGQIGARTWIEGQGGSSNTSNVEISAARDVIVNGGYAQYGSVRGQEERERDPVLLEGEEGGQIMAGAKNGSFNTANVEIYAGRDVIVQGAEVEYVGPVLPDDYGDFYYDGGQILALTWGSGDKNGGDLDENTSSIGIYAQRDVTIHDATIKGEPFDIDFPETEPFDVDLPGGKILAGAHGENSINDADIEIGGQDDVTIDGEVIAEAGATPDPDNEHHADIRIWAGDQLGGSGLIYAEAHEVADVAQASITFFVTALGNLVFDGEAWSWDGEEIAPEVVVGPVDVPDVSESGFDWIDWTWCEDCEASRFYAAAPLVQLPLDIPLIMQGCPVEIEAAANELGITPGAIQVSIANALALNPTLQACNACATLIDAAGILRDEDGSRMAAMTQMFNNMAPADSPYTPEMQALIATAFAGAAEGSQYATVMEYTDAFVRYLAVLETDLASPVGDSLAFVMDKYGAGVLGSDNSNIAAFVATRLESGETFGE